MNTNITMNEMINIENNWDLVKNFVKMDLDGVKKDAAEFLNEKVINVLEEYVKLRSMIYETRAWQNTENFNEEQINYMLEHDIELINKYIDNHKDNNTEDSLPCFTFTVEEVIYKLFEHVYLSFFGKLVIDFITGFNDNISELDESEYNRIMPIIEKAANHVIGKFNFYTCTKDNNGVHFYEYNFPDNFTEGKEVIDEYTKLTSRMVR